jgi:ABC-2 type transport system ATP-binding protein
MNMMTGCLSATAGHVRIDGHDIFEEPKQAKRLIGYLPEQPPLYMNETPAEYLRFVGEAKGLRGAELDRQIQDALARTKTDGVQNRRIAALSKGYKQRVGIAQALIGDPKVIILDEPTVGLDPIQIVEIRDLIKQLGQDHTVILSSHILSEVQTICEKVLMIAHGKLVAFDAPGALEKSLLSSNEITITADAPANRVQEILSSLDSISEIQLEETDETLTVAHLKTNCQDLHDASRQLFFAFAGQGVALLETTLNKASLEDVFIELSGGAAAPAEDTEEQEEADA